MTNEMINGVILQKLQTLDEALTELRSLGSVTIEQLERDWRTRKAIERNLQIMVEIVIDICQRILSVTQQIPASTSADAIERCAQMGVISHYEGYEKMVRLRNFIVHRYEKIDLTILVGMINRYLGDFDRFREEILAYVQR
jgi:uncharacterized protein YutE (UPF0331/DUF86 family)